MDASVVLPSSASNGFSPPSAAAVFRPTSTSSLTVKADLDGDPRLCSDDTTYADRADVSQASVMVDLRHPAADMTSTSGTREQLIKDRQRVAWDEMHDRMERRRREWNTQVDRMRTDFFKLKPPTSPTDVGKSSTIIAADRRQQRVIHVEPSWSPTTITRQQFQASFDLSEYSVDEIKVQTDGRRLIVGARHEQTETDAKKTYSREFSRQIDIPRYVDASRLKCTLSDKGILHVEADAIACSSSCLPVSQTITDRPPQPRCSLPPPRSPPNSTCTTASLSTIHPIILYPDGTCMFRVSVSLSADFDANELTVKTIDRRLIVTAQRDETGPGRRASCREFHHEFDLPQSVEPETVTAHVTDDGQLVVEAPLPPALNTSAD